jgi:UDP-N-acetylmuramate dehydrogenase
VCAASGVLLDHLARESASSGLAGLEWAVGIPGTVGGAVVQNAGAFGSSLADVLLEVRVASPRVAGKRLCTIRTSSPDDLSLGYRTSRFRRPDGRPSTEVILSVCLQLCSRPREELCQCMTRYRQSRRAAQPWLPNAGSVFKNPPGDYAARLIEGAGLKGARHGDAMVAPEHANFIVNLGSARASDVKCLMNHVRATVDQEFGVNLEPEIQLVGEWHGSCR